MEANCIADGTITHGKHIPGCGNALICTFETGYQAPIN